MAIADYRSLFLLAAKAGSLEGYLFQREKLEPLANWVGHISEMYRDLPPQLKRAVNPELAVVLERTLSYGERSLDAGVRDVLVGLLRETRGKSPEK